MVAVDKIKFVISKIILKRSKKVKIKILKVKVNLRRRSNIYRYNIINNIRQILANIFFENLIEFKLY